MMTESTREGALSIYRDRVDRGLQAFRAAQRFDPEYWDDNYGPKLRER